MIMKIRISEATRNNLKTEQLKKIEKRINEYETKKAFKELEQEELRWKELEDKIYLLEDEKEDVENRCRELEEELIFEYREIKTMISILQEENEHEMKIKALEEELKRLKEKKV